MPLDQDDSYSIFERDTLKSFFGDEPAPKKPQEAPPAVLKTPGPTPAQEPPTFPAHEARAVVHEPAAAPSQETVVSSKTKKAKKAKPARKISARARTAQDILAEEPFNAPSAFFEKKGRVISVINQKGGCGKTTTSINLAAGLALEGFKVLLIDIDAQANSTLGYGLRLEATEKSVYHVFRESIYADPEATPFSLIRKTALVNVFVLPSSRFLTTLAAELIESKDWEYLLRNYLAQVKSAFHYVIIDCPPALNAITVNALTASDEMLIPLQTHYFSLEGMKELFISVRSVQEKLNPLLKNGLILPTLFDKRARVNREMLQSIREYFKDKVLDTVIHMNAKLMEASMHGEPTLTYDPSSRGAKDYRALAREIISRDATLSDGKTEALVSRFILEG